MISGNHYNIYTLANYLAARAELDWIIDVGCHSLIDPAIADGGLSVMLIGTTADVRAANKTLPNATIIEHNLENGLPNISNETVSRAVVICSDIIEQLNNPEILMQNLAELSKKAPYLIITTPDRSKTQDTPNHETSTRPTHVTGWNEAELIRLMSRSGFPWPHLFGHSANINHRCSSRHLISISGTQTAISNSVPKRNIAAIIHVYNEIDILPETISHLTEQGVDIHIFDNWSSDGTWPLLKKMKKEGMIKFCRRFPLICKKTCEWYRQLQRTAAYAHTLDADWIIHQDADEIRVSPWAGINLNQAISNIDALGFNAIDFTVIDFRFLRNQPNIAPPYQANLSHFEFGMRPGHFLQIKCWKNISKVNLADSGGHEAIFDGRKVYPIKFLLKHYPLRNKEQAKRKIFKDRLPRFGKERKRYGWHIQYDSFAETCEINGWNQNELIEWHPDHFQKKYLVERISGIGLADENSIS